jgi:tetratricopeptide (TPR) repeat protein
MEPNIPPIDKHILAMQYFHSGVEKFFEGMTEDAKQNLLLAIKIDKSLSFAYCYLSSIYCEDGHAEKGIEICQEGLGVHPSNSYLHFCLGLAYHQNRKFSEAIAEFLIYHRYAPTDAECLFMIASTYEELKQQDLAKQYYQSTMAVDPLHFRSYFNLGLIEEQDKNFNKAIELFKQVVSIRNDYWKAWVRLGLLYFRENQIENAINSYLHAIKYMPDLIDVHYNLGISYRLINKPQLAISSFRTVISKNPTDADAWYNLGMAYLDLRDYPTAKSCMFKALGINLEHSEAHYRLGYLYLLAGEQDKANREIEYLQKTQSHYAPLLQELFKVFGSTQFPQK